MDRTSQSSGPSFSQPLRPIVSMLAVLGLVTAGVWIGREVIFGILAVNPWLNGFIALVFLLGVVTCFWQLAQLARSVVWIKGFVGRRAGYDARSAPQLLAPLAALLAHRTNRMQISTISQRSILDSVATRLDEAREITRYLGNLLIFLGLLGTFYGLATTIPAMVETIRNLAPAEGESGVDVFAKLIVGLESQLGGMGTAFSSSLLGLAGSLVVGLLDLFAGHGQNRFFRELEEWSSTITRVGLSPSDTGGEGEGTAGSGVLSEQIEALAAVVERGEAARAASDARVVALIGTIDRLAARLEADGRQAPDVVAGQQQAAAAQSAALDRIAAGQEAAAAALAVLAAPEGGPHVDAESRMRLRSIDVQLLRILEEISAGRQESISDLRADLAALTAAIRQLGRGAGVR
ncbi:MAG: biopolymer transporter ExbB [Gemmobacter sp.]